MPYRREVVSGVVGRMATVILIAIAAIIASSFSVFETGVWDTFDAIPGTFIIILCISIIAIRRDHASHVYTLWYVFFLVATSFFIFLWYLWNTKSPLLFNDYFQLPRYEQLLNSGLELVAPLVPNELYFWSMVLALVIIPQLFSFIVSGIFGCGSPPILISAITRYTIFGVIKYFCVVAGVLAGTSLFRVFHGLDIPVTPENIPKFTKYQGLLINSVSSNAWQALITISLSFAILAIYYKIGVVSRHITSRSRYKPLRLTLMYMSRYHEKDAVEK